MAVCQEWFWNKKEERNDSKSSNDYTDIAELWLKINSYKKNMVSLYEKAIEEFSKDILKFSPSSADLADEEEPISVFYALRDIARSTRYYATNKESPINSCRKAFEQQLKTIGLDLKKIDTNNNYAYDTYLYWYPGEDGIYSFYDKELVPDEYAFILTTTYDGYSKITAAFKSMDITKLTNVLKILLKEIDSCVEKGYKIKTPTLDKLYDKYVDSQMAQKYWDDKCELASAIYYGFIRQGMYLHDPKFTKDKLKEEVKAIANKYDIKI